MMTTKCVIYIPLLMSVEAEVLWLLKDPVLNRVLRNI